MNHFFFHCPQFCIIYHFVKISTKQEKFMYIVSLFYHHSSRFLHTILFSKRKKILTMLITRMKFRAIIPCQIEKIPTSYYFEKRMIIILKY